MKRSTTADGFTLIELLVAAAILIVVTGTVFGVMHPSRGVFQAQSETSDLQQKLRVGVATLHRELLMAGAGTYSGPARGPLHRFVAPIVPMRMGASGGDPAGTVRGDAVTIVYVPATSAQTTLRDATAVGADEVWLEHQAGCPVGDAQCGFTEGMRVLVFDDSGSSGVYTVSAAEPSHLRLRHRDGWPAVAHDVGAAITEVESHTFYYDRQELQLRHFDGHQTDLPVLDNVVGLSFAYFGDPQPPLLQGGADPGTIRPTYGPAPPTIGIDNESDAWPAGENCVFASTGSGHVPRLPLLGPPDGGLVPLNSSLLLDGPWCPDIDAPNRYDADLLRVPTGTRRVAPANRGDGAARAAGQPGARRRVSHRWHRRESLSSRT